MLASAHHGLPASTMECCCFGSSPPNTVYLNLNNFSTNHCVQVSLQSATLGWSRPAKKASCDVSQRLIEVTVIDYYRSSSGDVTCLCQGNHGAAFFCSTIAANTSTSDCFPPTLPVDLCRRTNPMTVPGQRRQNDENMGEHTFRLDSKPHVHCSTSGRQASFVYRTRQKRIDFCQGVAMPSAK